MNRNITYEIVRDNPQHPWNMDDFGSNSRLNWDYIRTNLPSPGCSTSSIIGRNTNITWDIVKANPEYRWDWGSLAQNPNITWKIICDNPDKAWHWRAISTNPNITWDIIQANPDKPWAWDMVSCNPSIIWDIIDANPHISWSWEFMCYNDMGYKCMKESKQRCIARCKAIRDELELVTRAPAYYYKWVIDNDELAELMTVREDDTTWCQERADVIRHWRWGVRL